MHRHRRCDVKCNGSIPDIFSLPRTLSLKLVMSAFRQGKFARVYGRQGKLVQEIFLYMGLANNRRPWREINVKQHSVHMCNKTSMSWKTCWTYARGKVYLLVCMGRLEKYVSSQLCVADCRRSIPDKTASNCFSFIYICTQQKWNF
jgi:hypothetical protein